MKWNTELIPEKIKTSLCYQDKIMAFGSCFAENIGDKLNSLKYDIDINPFGIQYNPVSIANALISILNERQYLESDLTVHRNLWHSFDHHGDFSANSKDLCLQNINKRLETSKLNISKTKFFLITLGTSRVYYRKDNDKIVNNCHKFPADFFYNRRLSSEEIYTSLKIAFSQLLESNKDIQIILTVSPIRHLKDGFIENQLSKSTLLLVSDMLCRDFKQVHYFPAYEIMMDDLRDYRFYKTDLLHPNEVAVDYIYQRFEYCCLSEKETDLRKKIRNIMLSVQHKLLNPESEESRQFIQNQINNIEKICSDYHFLDFSTELNRYKMMPG